MNSEKHILLMGNIREFKTVAKKLKYEGFNVDIAESGIDCISKYKTNEYDIVMLNAIMPKMTGIEVAKKIRIVEMEKKIYTPIVLISNCDINFRNAILNGINWCMDYDHLNIEDMLLTLNKFKLI